MEQRVELPGDAKDGWCFTYAGRTTGPWIVTAWRGDALLSRPALLVVKEAEPRVIAETPRPTLLEFRDTAPVRTVYGASIGFMEGRAADSEAVPHHSADGALDLVPALETIVGLDSREERYRLMREAVARMAKDASHPDWELAQGFLDAMKHFPADSYEFNRAVAEHHEATALVMLRGAFLGSMAHLWSGFEQFHFLWVTFPLRGWTRAMRIYRNTAFPSVPEESRAPLLKLVLGRCFASGESTEYRSVIWNLCARTIHGVPSAPNRFPAVSAQQRADMVRSVAQGEMERVMQQHSDEFYPQLPSIDEFLPPSIAVAVAMLMPEVGMGFRRDVAKAPLVAAAASVHALVPSPKLFFELRRVRDFDLKYFDTVYYVGLACLALDALDKNHDYFN
jgi:hypothetical protein